MKYFWLSFKAIFIKDIVTELRARQVLPTMIVMGILIVWILRIASEAASASIVIIGPVSLWIALLFSGLMAQERSFATEQEQDCICGLLLAPVDEGTIYLSKLFVNIVMLCIFELIIVPIVVVAFHLDITANWPVLVGVLLLGNIGLSSVGTLFSAMVQLTRFSAMVQLTRTRGSLLSILVLVILMPMMIPVTFALLALFDGAGTQIAGTGALALVGSIKAAVGYMVAFDAVFVVVCWLLFPFAIKE
ncbi:MAG: heme exporter protein CcmB [Planctomycetota bacterium]|jgi:heme exporter protein B